MSTPLVEKVEQAMWAGEHAPDASAAIRTTATWLRAHGHASAASALEKEVGE